MGLWVSEQNVGVDWTGLGDTPLDCYDNQSACGAKKNDSSNNDDYNDNHNDDI